MTIDIGAKSRLTGNVLVMMTVVTLPPRGKPRKNGSGIAKNHTTRKPFSRCHNDENAEKMTFWAREKASKGHNNPNHPLSDISIIAKSRKIVNK